MYIGIYIYIYIYIEIYRYVCLIARQFRDSFTETGSARPARHPGKKSEESGRLLTPALAPRAVPASLIVC